MTIKLSAAGAALALVAACQTAPMDTVSPSAEVPVAMSMTEQLATTTCATPAPARDNWLRAERPAVEDLRASYIERGFDPAESGVFQAYAAYIAAGQDHNRAAAAFGPDYARSAACFA